MYLASGSFIGWYPRDKADWVRESTEAEARSFRELAARVGVVEVQGGLLLAGWFEDWRCRRASP